jgi:hypothetical protein
LSNAIIDQQRQSNIGYSDFIRQWAGDREWITIGELISAHGHVGRRNAERELKAQGFTYVIEFDAYHRVREWPELF